MKKLLLLLLLPLLLVGNSFAEQERIFPPSGYQQFLGIDDNSSPLAVKDGRASDIQNIVLDSTGSASKRNGYSFHVMLDTAATVDDFEAVTGMHEIYKSTGTRTKISNCGSKLFAITSAGVASDITAAVTITEGKDKTFSWITALDYGIGTNNVDPPLRTTGATTTALAFTGFSNAVTDAKCVIWWKNYLIFGNTTENAVVHSTRIRWSNVGTIETWTNDDYVDIATLGGQQIEGMATLYDSLYIFLTDSIYKVSLVGGEELINVSKVSEGIGCIAKNSIQNIQVGNSEGLIFLSRDKTINFLDGTSVTEISTNISGVMGDLNSSRLPYAVSIDDQENAHYYLAVTTGSDSTNNLLLDFNYATGEWSKHTGINSNAFCIANDTNNKPQIYFGNYKSFVYQLSDPDKYSDVAGEVGIIDSVGTIDTTTASGLTVYYDSSATFTDVTGATVTITTGTGVGEENVIVATTASGIVVTPSGTGIAGSGYSIGAIDAYYTTKWYDMGSATMRKNFGELFLWSAVETSTDIQLYYSTDFSSTVISDSINLSSNAGVWGTAVWGTDTWGGAETILNITPLNVSGRFIKYKFSESEIDKPMELIGFSTLLWDLTNI